MKRDQLKRTTSTKRDQKAQKQRKHPVHDRHSEIQMISTLTTLQQCVTNIKLFCRRTPQKQCSFAKEPYRSRASFLEPCMQASMHFFFLYAFVLMFSLAVEACDNCFQTLRSSCSECLYGVALVSRIDKIIGLFCQRGL